jgi:diguanylate cyclase (GGDEF)-like protein/PAS domain S-box-containing protein
MKAGCSEKELRKEIARLRAEVTRLRKTPGTRESAGDVLAVLDALPNSVKLYDEDRQLVYINQTGLELHQAADLESFSRSSVATVMPNLVNEAIEVHRQVLAGETVVGTYEILGLEGRRVHVESHAVPFRLPDGKRGHMCLSHDVTARLAADRALRRSEERLRLVQEATDFAHFEADMEGIAHFSERFVEHVGLPPETTRLSHEQWLKLVHPDDREHFQKEIGRSFESDNSFDFEFRIIRADTGEVRWISSHTKTKRDAAGDTLRVGAHLDITDRKRVEEALRESEERFRLAAEAAGLGVWDYDPAADTREWSPRLREILGIAPDAKPTLDLAIECIHAEDQFRFLKHLLDLREGRGPDRFEASLRVQPIGAERWIAVTGWRTLRSTSGLSRIILAVRDITEEKTAGERIHWSATHDVLTGLANRALFQAELEKAIASAAQSGRSVGVLMLDVDHFKEINDTLGHDAGDTLLNLFGKRLQSTLRSGDTVARLGGDEFAIVLPELQDDQGLTTVTESILARLREPFVLSGRILDCRASIGASSFPNHGRTAGELLKNADLAMYAAKSAGRAASALFEPRMRADAQRRSSMVHLARSALKADRIMPYYQPKIGLRDGSIVGFEALLRWRDANGRIHLPSSIEAAFEDLDVATALSDRIIECSITDMRSWLERGIPFKHVAVNASAAEFRRDNFAERVLDRLHAAKVPARYFQLEVTETVFLGRGAESVHRALALLSAAGVKIALDDFGTGYASLRHLKQFPVDIIKIDQSFVRDMQEDVGDDAIVRAVINLGRSLGIKVVAEGIETQQQADRLLQLKCDFGQGFLYSKAVPAGRVPAIVSRRKFEWPTDGQQKASGLRLVAARL